MRSSAATSSRTVEGNGTAASIDARRETDRDADADSDSSGNGDGGRNDSIDARCFDIATPMLVLRSADGHRSSWAISPSAVNARRPLRESTTLAADIRTDRLHRFRSLHGKHRYTGAHLSETVEDLRESLYWSGMFDDDLRES